MSGGAFGHLRAEHRVRRGQRKVQGAVRESGRACAAKHDYALRGRGCFRCGKNRVSRRAASRIHTWGHGRRLCGQRGAAERNYEKRAAPFSRQTGACGKEHKRLQGNRVRGCPRRERHGDSRLQYGKPRPCGNTHGRQHSGRAKSDAYKQGISAFERQRAQNHTGVENRGRLQRTVRAGPAVLRLFFDRGKSESFPFVGFGKQGERIPHCARVRKNSGGYASRRNNACKHSRVLRAGS